MDPITTSLLYAAITAGVTTARPRWEFTPPVGAGLYESPLGTGLRERTSNVDSYLKPPQEEASLFRTNQTSYSTPIEKFPSRIERLVFELEAYADIAEHAETEKVPPSAAAIGEAIAFINNFPAGLPLPSPTLASDGEIGFYWNSEGGYVDIQLDEPGKLSFYARNRIDDSEEFEDSLSWRELGRRWYEQRLSVLTAHLAQAA